MRGAASKVMWVGRATVFMVGLSVILALVFGVATSALGANGKPFLLGKSNAATLVSTLVKKSAGPALSLKVGSGPPLAVNSSGKVANLNADTLDGKDSTQFLTSSNIYQRDTFIDGYTGQSGFLSCDAGDIALGGAYMMNRSSGYTITSYGLSSPDRYYIEWASEGTIPAGATLYLTCLDQA